MPPLPVDVGGQSVPLEAPRTYDEPAFQGIERRSIDYVTHSERHGLVRDQVTTWFMGQFQLMTLSIGFIGPSMGLSFGWACVASVLGVLFGTIFMACHASQGPVMGLPQLIQSRAQFGFRGVIVPLLAVLTDYIGYNVIGAVVIMGGLHSVFGISKTLSIATIAVVTGILAIYGHDWLHIAAKVIFWITAPLLAVLSLGIAAGRIPSEIAAGGAFTLVGFGSQFAAAASNQIAIAPLTSDYSRYLPPDTPAGRLIGALFVGASTSAIWLLIIGAWLASYIGATDPVAAIHAAGSSLAPSIGLVIAIATAVMTFCVLAMDNYSGSLVFLTVWDSLRPIRPTTALRALTVVGVVVVWVVLALAGGENLIGTAWLVMTILLYVLVPWTSVNLVDFFFVRHGKYAITHLFKPDGIYGAWAWRGLLAYALGLAATVPFAVLPDVYTGPVARALGGVDIGWVVGLVVSGLGYKLIAPSVEHEAAAIAASNRELEGLA
jgi:nucleobase:cation symporter-1, NCS1 family